jgi:hypothetical protein
VEVTVPEVEEMRLAHYVTMGSECSASVAKYVEKLSAPRAGQLASVIILLF